MNLVINSESVILTSQCPVSDDLKTQINSDVIDAYRSVSSETDRSTTFNSLITRFEAGDKIRKSINVSDPTSQNKNKIGLKSPLVQIMQSNEKKISENLKVHRDKYLLKKLKRREKEAKSNSERKRVKKEQNYIDFVTKLSLKRSMIPVGKVSKM